MSTQLMFMSAALLQKLTGSYWYPHLIYFDPQTNRWKVEQNQWSLTPFYISFFGIILGLGVFSVLFLILRQLLGFDSKISVNVITIQIFLLLASVICWGFNIPTVKYSEFMVEYVNVLLDFENLINKKIFCYRKIKYNNQAKVKWKIFLHERSVKFKKDFVGTLLVALVFYSQLFQLAGTAIGVYFKLDPFFYVLPHLKLNILVTNTICFTVLRTVLAFICITETVRTSLLLFIPIIIHHCVFIDLLETFRSVPFSRFVLPLYNKLRIIHAGGDFMTAYSVYLNLGFAFATLLLLNCVVILGWKIFPAAMYILLVVPMTIFLYAILHESLPLLSRCHEVSSGMIKYDLPLRTFRAIRWYGWKQNRVLYKQIRSLRPISFHSASVATLDKDTRRNFLAHAILKTMDLLLLWGNALDKYCSNGNC